MFEDIQIKRYVKVHFLGEVATICRARLLALLASLWIVAIAGLLRLITPSEAH